jgi:molybdopterin molybdotransferase
LTACKPAPPNHPVYEGVGRVLAAPVSPTIDLPPFSNSSMDGYAVRAADLNAGRPTTRSISLYSAMSPPAASLDITLRPGTAARIMTGAPVPAGADAVVPVEDTDEQWRSDAERPLPETIAVTAPSNRAITSAIPAKMCSADRK